MHLVLQQGSSQAAKYHQLLQPPVANSEHEHEMHPPTHHLSNANEMKLKHFTCANVIDCTRFESVFQGFVISPRTTRRLPKGTSSSEQLLRIWKNQTLGKYYEGTRIHDSLNRKNRHYFYALNFAASLHFIPKIIAAPQACSLLWLEPHRDAPRHSSLWLAPRRNRADTLITMAGTALRRSLHYGWDRTGT